MPTTYKSKIGLELVIPIGLVLGGSLLLFLLGEPKWIGLAIILPVIAFVVHLFATTNYTIDGKHLIIKSGFLVNKTIEIHSIKKIIETNNPVSSPATSMDRLEITYGKFDSIVISPKEKLAFIEDLKRINPDIEVKFKEKKS